jgi:hypothetical protein
LKATDLMLDSFDPVECGILRSGHDRQHRSTNRGQRAAGAVARFDPHASSFPNDETDESLSRTGRDRGKSNNRWEFPALCSKIRGCDNPNRWRWGMGWSHTGPPLLFGLQRWVSILRRNFSRRSTSRILRQVERTGCD